MEPRLPKGTIYGRMLKRVEVAELILTETTCSANLSLKPHSHEWPYFCFVLRGGYSETSGGKTRLCKPASLVFHPSDEVHSNQIQNCAAKDFCIAVAPGWVERVREYSPLLNNPAHFQGGDPTLLAAKLYCEFQQMDEVSPLAIEALALEIVVAASRRPTIDSKRNPPWLKRARDILHERFTESLRVSDLAASVGVHPAYLAGEFRHLYGRTIGEYVRRLRVRQACREMIESDASIAEIAAMVGFYDQSHFSRVFKQLTGMTPIKYRACFRSP